MVASLEIQKEFYGDPKNNAAYGEGPMQSALQRLRCSLATSFFRNTTGFVLDLGCGQGKVLQALTQNNIKAIGLDAFHLRVKDTSQRIPGPDYVAALGQHLPFPSNSLAGICCFEVFEHLFPNEGSSMLAEIHRVLKPQSYCIITTPNHKNLSRRIRQLFGSNQLPRADHLNEVAYDFWKIYMHSFGFVNISVNGIGILPGIWRLQHHFPYPWLQDTNIRLGYQLPSLASETLVVAQKV